MSTLPEMPQVTALQRRITAAWTHVADRCGLPVDFAATTFPDEDGNVRLRFQLDSLVERQLTERAEAAGRRRADFLQELIALALDAERQAQHDHTRRAVDALLATSSIEQVLSVVAEAALAPKVAQLHAQLIWHRTAPKRGPDRG